MAAILRWSAALLCALAVQLVGYAAPLRLVDLEGRPVDPFAHPSTVRASVFLFVSVECPVSNRYAPEVKRLHDEFAPRGADLVLVYPNPADTPAKISEHLKAFSYPVRALRDPQHDFAKLTGATITPEAAVYDARGTLAYRGRIDDRYVSIGVERPAATRHDLADAISATLAGRAAASPRTDAVGCFIADFVP